MKKSSNIVALWRRLVTNPSTTATIIIGFVATIGSFFKVIPSDQVSTAILTVTCFLAIESLMGRNKRFDDIDKQLAHLRNPSVPIYPGYVQIFKSEKDWYPHVTKKMLGAQHSISDASLTQRRWDTKSEEANAYYVARRQVIESGLHYRYVATYSDEHDQERYKDVRDYS